MEDSPPGRRFISRRVIQTITYLKVGGLGVELIFNRNVIKLGDNIEYIKEAVNTIAVLRIK